MHHLASRQPSNLPITIIRRRHLHHICPDNLQPFEPVKNSQQFPGTPAPYLCRPCGRCKGRIQHIDINGDIDFVVSNPVFQFVDDTVDPESIDVAGCDDRETAVPVVSEVVVTVCDGAANASVDGSVGNETFFVGEVKEGSVIYSAVVMLV
jgi:hypothetical protein